MSFDRGRAGDGPGDSAGGRAAERVMGRWIQHPKAVLIWALALALGCLRLAWETPLEWIPTVGSPGLHVTATWPGASPESVEAEVTAPIERLLQSLTGVVGVESTSQAGQAALRVSLDREVRLSSLFDEVSDRLYALRSTLPPGVEPRIEAEVPEDFRRDEAVVVLQVVGERSPEALRRVADEIVAPRLRRIPGVAGIQVFGGATRELRVVLDDLALARHGIDSLAVRSRLAEAFERETYGSFLLEEDLRQARLVREPVAGVDEVRGLALRTSAERGGIVRLGDVARVELTEAPAESIDRIDGQPAVTLVLDRDPAGHVLAISKQVRQTLATADTEIPPDVRVLIADDYGEEVRDSVTDFGVRSGLGILLVTLALALMLRNARAVVVVLLAASIAILAAAALLGPLGLSLNVLTLSGLVLVVGLLIDNAVVVVEELLAESAAAERSGTSPGACAVRALGKVWIPLLGSTATTIAVLAPLVYLSGELRTLFLPFGLLVALTLAFSLVAAVVLVPVLVRWLQPTTTRARRRRPTGRPWPSLPSYLASKHPEAILIGLFLLVGLPTFLVPRSLETPVGGWRQPGMAEVAERFHRTLGSERFLAWRERWEPWFGGVVRPFFTQVPMGSRWDFGERPELKVHLRLPPGSETNRASRLLTPFEELALASPDVQRTFARADGANASLRILFEERATTGPGPMELRQSLIRQALTLAGVEVGISGLTPIGYHSGQGQIAGYLVELVGPSYDELGSLMAGLAARLERDPRVAEVDLQASASRRPPGPATLALRWDADATLRSRLTARTAADILQSEVTRLSPDLWLDLPTASRLPVRLVSAPAEGEDVVGLMSRPLRGPEGVFDLATLTSLGVAAQPKIIERSDQRYRRHLRVAYRGPFELGAALVEREIRAMDLPLGYRVERVSNRFLTSSVSWQLLAMLLATAALVYLVLAAVFESWRLPLLVFLSLPTAFVGVAALFLATGCHFAEGAFIGLVLLVGIAVNDSVLVVARYRDLRRGRPASRAPKLARLAVRQRLLPMWTTTLTTVASMLPLLIGGSGDFWRGLAVVVVGGVTSSTLLMPLATVALLSWSHARRPSPEWSHGSERGRIDRGREIHRPVHAPRPSLSDSAA